MRILLGLCAIVLSLQALGATELPKGCKPIAVQKETLTINTKKPRLIFIHNTTENDLWITHQVADSGANTGSSSRIQANNWSALVVSKGPYTMECIESKPGHEQQIPCLGSVVLCQYKKTKMPPSRQPDYWAAEDMSLRALTSAVGGKGFEIPS